MVKRTPQEDIDTDEIIALYIETGGNIMQTAKALNLNRATVRRRVRLANVYNKPVVDGKVKVADARKISKPRSGKTKRVIFSSIQNNTHVHPATKNLLAYSSWLNKGEDTCEFFLGSYSYNLNAYGEMAVKRGKAKGGEKRLWYDPEYEQYIHDDPIEIGPGLLWAGNSNTLPTNRMPLSGLDRYGGRRSVITPHAKQHLSSVPSMMHEATKFLFSTGTISTRNYIQKRAGIMAEEEHTYGGLLVEITSDGNWYCRHLVIDSKGAVYDVGPSWSKSCVKIENQKVTTGHRPLAINWGDVHVAELEEWVRQLCWDRGGVLDTLNPMHQFFHDLFSMRSRSHHELRRFERVYKKWLEGEESVESEIMDTVEFTKFAHRKNVLGHVVSSNHDRHLEGWLDNLSYDFRDDPQNSKFYLKAAHARVEALEARQADFSVLSWALRLYGCPEELLFSARDSSLVLGKEWEGGVEFNLHGDEGPNGARGNDTNLKKLSRRLNKGHSHVAFLDQCGVGSAATCTLDLPYLHGPSSHSISHLLTFPNTARQMLTMWDNNWRA